MDPRIDPTTQPPMPKSFARLRSGSLIGSTVKIKGELTAEEDLVVRGRVEGVIEHDQTLTVDADGTLDAEVKAREVIVEGTVNGNLYGTSRVQIAETARVNGNVYAPRIGVVEGAAFKGCVDMEPDTSSIEKRFAEVTGRAAPVRAEKNAKAEKDTSAIAIGDDDAAQAADEGIANAESQSDSGGDA